MSWVQTLKNKQVDFLNPDIHEIDLEDIATGLAYAFHFGGHTKDKITVAEHCVLVSRQAEAKARGYSNATETFIWCCSMWGLLHDAHEAYTGDLPGPLKRLLDADSGPANVIRRAEQALDEVIIQKYMNLTSLPAHVKPLVKSVDQRMVYTEHVRLQGTEPKAWTLSYQPYTKEEVPVMGNMSSEDSLFMFKTRFRGLANQTLSS